MTYVTCGAGDVCACARVRPGVMARIADVVSQECRGGRMVRSNDQGDADAPARYVSRYKISTSREPSRENYVIVR